MQVKYLNSGTFGFVQLCRDKRTNEQVAIKFIARGDKVRCLIMVTRYCTETLRRLPRMPAIGLFWRCFQRRRAECSDIVRSVPALTALLATAAFSAGRTVLLYAPGLAAAQRPGSARAGSCVESGTPCCIPLLPPAFYSAVNFARFNQPFTRLADPPARQLCLPQHNAMRRAAPAGSLLLAPC